MGRQELVRLEADNSNPVEDLVCDLDGSLGLGLCKTYGWIARHDGPDGGADTAIAVTVTPDGSTVVVTGQSMGDGSGRDYATVAYDAQDGGHLWEARYDGPTSGFDIPTDIGISPDGARVYVTGLSPGVNKVDYATIAYDVADGSELWVTRYDGPDNEADKAQALAVSPDGSRVFVTGSSVGAGSGQDYATIAYDSVDGQPTWAARYDGTANGFDEAKSIAVSPDGSQVFVTGQSFGSGTSHDYVTIAYDTEDGQPSWEARYDGPSGLADRANALAVSSDGSRVFVTGQSRGGGTLDDYVTIAYDTADGQQVWAARYDGPANSGDVPSGIVVSADDSSVFVTGQSPGEGTGVDYATVAYDASDGAERWIARFDAGATDQAAAIGISGATVVVTGTSRGSETGQDFATVAYDVQDGTTRWEARYDGPARGSDGATALRVSPDGTTVYVTGESTGDGTGKDYATIAYGAEEPKQTLAIPPELPTP